MAKPSVNVWCATWAKWIIGPFFTEKGTKNPHIVSVPRPDSGQGVLKAQVVRLTRVWFQQEGVTHCWRCAQLPKENLPGKVISKNVDAQWSPRSRGLTVPEFWLWVYLKGKPVHLLWQL